MSNIDTLIYPKKGKRKNIFFSGKGGVGKTSVACITAIETALKGYKTLLITTDPAAHIGNVLTKPVGNKVTRIEGVENLYAVKIDAKETFEDYKKAVLQESLGKFSEETIAAMEEELNSPCTEEMAVFQIFIEYFSQDEFEVIVFDTAPTGHTLRLLELPMDWSKQIEFKTGATAELNDADAQQKARFDKVIEIMKDSQLTTFSFVMYPEKTPIIEAYRASKELEALGIKTQLAVVNLIIPEEQAVSEFFQKRRNMQIKYIQEAKALFSEAEIMEIPMFEKEIKGLAMLSRLAELIF